ncbi:hypothetical protein J3F83DRAFT_636876 [Trichoderma novae-zelandiae]
MDWSSSSSRFLPALEDFWRASRLPRPSGSRPLGVSGAEITTSPRPQHLQDAWRAEPPRPRRPPGTRQSTRYLPRCPPGRARHRTPYTGLSGSLGASLHQTNLEPLICNLQSAISLVVCLCFCFCFLSFPFRPFFFFFPFPRRDPILICPPPSFLLKALHKETVGIVFRGPPVSALAVRTSSRPLSPTDRRIFAAHSLR